MLVAGGDWHISGETLTAQMLVCSDINIDYIKHFG